MTEPGGRVKTVLVMSYGMLAVFDAAGAQMPQYQQRIGLVGEDILRDAREDVEILDLTARGWRGRLLTADQFRQCIADDQAYAADERQQRESDRLAPYRAWPP